MCDTFVAVPAGSSSGATWFGKNSDREPGEAQVVEHRPEQHHGSRAKVQCTYLELPQAVRTHEVLLSRPVWMWGAEMGTNARGITIGNEAVFTRLPVARTGLTGMDLVRLALERCSTAREALELITDFLGRYGSGGGCGFRNRRFRYHNAFLIADPECAWVLETAGPHWVAERVRGIRTISNVLSIDDRFDLISDGTYEFARRQGWCRGTDDFGFARCFGDPLMRHLTGGLQRRGCTFERLYEGHPPGLPQFMAASREHGGRSPAQGWRLEAPCAHASWWPTRHGGQTTAAMISCLKRGQLVHWLTGTSSPCLSVFKPVVLGGAILDAGPAPEGSTRRESLFWRHERLHRSCLEDYEARAPIVEPWRQRLEEQSLPNADGVVSEHWQAIWDEHREILPEWVAAMEAVPGRRRWTPFQAFWARQRRRDQMS